MRVMLGLYRHRGSGSLYRAVLNSFSVERQRASVIYVGLERGEVFDADAESFQADMDLVKERVQEALVPKHRRAHS